MLTLSCILRLVAAASGRRWAVLLILPVILSSAGCNPGKPRVVLYCAQDQEFAEQALADFTQQAGFPVAPKFDTEKDKSVSLYRELVAEKARPRCDVFWNNEILNTIRLQREGLIDAYESPSAASYPAWAKASDRTWHAFAARARVLVVNTQLVKEAERPKSLLDLSEARWAGKAVMAKPVHGTAATQGACLFQVMGEERARAYYLALKKNRVQIAPGNKQVAEWVAQGRTPRGDVVSVGVTDTDDALGEMEKGAPLVMIFPDGDGMGTLFIPNSLCILKGSPNPEGARRLVDFLLSAAVEAQLAESAGHQIPLNPEVKAKLPPEMQTPATVRAMSVDFEKATDLWPESQKFLAREFATD